MRSLDAVLQRQKLFFAQTHGSKTQTTLYCKPESSGPELGRLLGNYI